MKNSLISIPIEEVFEPKEGCPLCRLNHTLENRVVEYITGAAMMEPDVRIETNKTGFCAHHFDKMLEKRNKLSVALMLESHLASIEKRGFNGIFKDSHKQEKTFEEITKSCFICNQINENMTNIIANICILWEKDKSFQKLFSEQESICLPHLVQLLDSSQKNISKKNRSDFQKIATSISKRNIESLHKDISHFCEMFDYRNSGENADWGNSKDAIERTVYFLTGNINK